MKVVRTIIILSTLCLLLGASAARAQLVIEHSGAFDPEAEGWTKVLADDPPAVLVEGFSVVPDPNFTEFNAWQIHSYNTISDPPQPGTGGALEYQYALTPARFQDANDIGWTFTAVWRLVEQEVNWGASNYLGVRLPTAWYMIRMGYGTVEERAIRMLAGNWAGWGGSQDIGPDDYYTTKLVYDPAAQQAELYVNDELVFAELSPWDGQPDTQEIRFRWGINDAGDSSAGRTNYSAVRVYVGVEPECGDDSHPYPVGDLDQDCGVDLRDFSMLAAHWLEDTAP